jgi:hypothetical protein
VVLECIKHKIRKRSHRYTVIRVSNRFVKTNKTRALRPLMFLLSNLNPSKFLKHLYLKRMSNVLLESRLNIQSELDWDRFSSNGIILWWHTPSIRKAIPCPFLSIPWIGTPKQVELRHLEIILSHAFLFCRATHLVWRLLSGYEAVEAHSGLLLYRVMTY